MSLHYIYYIIIVLVLLKIAYTDYMTQNIYDLDVLFGITVGLLYNYLNDSFILSISGLAAGIILSSIIYFSAKMYYGFEAFGSGEITSFSLFGILLGWQTFLYMFAIGTLAAGFISLILIFSKFKKKTDYIALAPFYCLSTIFFLLFKF